jgi:predicted nucleic acid-binding protein
MAVVDSSVAVRWFVHGPGADRAVPWLGETTLVAPDLILAEAGNALWRHVQAGDLQMEEAASILQRMPDCFSRLVPSAELARDALLLAHELDCPVYACAYLALAQREELGLLTLDAELAALAARKGIRSELLL